MFELIILNGLHCIFNTCIFKSAFAYTSHSKSLQKIKNMKGMLESQYLVSCQKFVQVDQGSKEMPLQRLNL